VQFSLTKSSQQRKTLQNSDDKQFCQYWILCWLFLTRFPANRDCLLKFYIRGFQTFLSDCHMSYYITVRGQGILRNVIFLGICYILTNRKYIIFIIDKISSRAGWNGVADRIWLAGCSLETLDLRQVVQDCEHEGPHYSLRTNLRAAKGGIPLRSKDSFAVLIDIIFAVRLTQVLIRFIIEKALSHITNMGSTSSVKVS